MNETSPTALAMFDAAVARARKRPMVRYFDAVLTYDDVDRMSDSFAAALVAGGVSPGDRVSAFLQNVPHFVITMVGAWKAGAIFSPINPMNRIRELALILDDSAPAALVMEDTLTRDVYDALPEGGHRPSLVFTASPLDFQSRSDARLFAGRSRIDSGRDLLATIAAHITASRPTRSPAPDDDAMIVYTSGTTGLPKGAVSTQRAVATAGRIARETSHLAEGEGVLTIAPLFHATGLIANIAAAVHAAGYLVLSYRFDPGVVLDAAREHLPTYVVGASTAFIAMMNAQDATREAFASLRIAACGGAPVAPAMVRQFESFTGLTLRTGYGLTETNCVVAMNPLDQPERVDASTNALSVGPACGGNAIWIMGDDGGMAPIGEAGEIVVSGPTVARGYWRKPEETAAAMTAEGFRTGDIAFIDGDGWLYIVDRKKDMISASGYKVWPREVEDVIYGHPAVREVAVVGVDDPYRGETVKAVISLKVGQEVTAEEIQAFCKARMAAYKYPRIVEFRDELPKTPTGKILRREVRTQAATT